LLPGAFQLPPDEDDVRYALFKTPPVEWNRMPQLQDVTVRLIAQNGIFHGKAPASKARPLVRQFSGVISKRNNKTRSGRNRRGSWSKKDAPIAASSELYLQNETAYTKVSLPPPHRGHKYHLFCSEFNAGALEVTEELMESDVFVTAGKGASAPLTVTTNAALLDECDHMLILLDARTWTSGTDTARLTVQIHKAMRLGVHIVCVHEQPAVVGPPRFACDFELMFNEDWTPAHLTNGATCLYKDLDISLKPEEWRQPGLVALAAKLATSAGEHKPIKVRVPTSYEPPTGANPWGDKRTGSSRFSWAHLETEKALSAAGSMRAPSLDAIGSMRAPSFDAHELVPLPDSMPPPPSSAAKAAVLPLAVNQPAKEVPPPPTTQSPTNEEGVARERLQIGPEQDGQSLTQRMASGLKGMLFASDQLDNGRVTV